MRYSRIGLRITVTLLPRKRMQRAACGYTDLVTWAFLLHSVRRNLLFSRSDFRSPLRRELLAS